MFYKAAVVSQGSVEFDPGVKASWADEGAAVKLFEEMVAGLLRAANFIEYYICFSDENVNFRKELEPTYKQNRNGFEKPVLLTLLNSHALHNHPSLRHDRLEADDVLGISATSGEFKNPVIISADKDLRQIPGEHLVNGKIVRITAEAGHLWHMTQTLIGDPVDGYKGCPGIGPKKAAAALDVPEGTSMWPAVVETYESCGLTEADALLQARLAYILQSGSYRARDSKIKLWNPDV